MKNLKSFNNFILESTQEEMMDYLTDITNKPESSGKIEVDTSNNPLWNQIWSKLSNIGNPKKIMWKDDWGSGVGMASLNWGFQKSKGGGVGLFIESYNPRFLITVSSSEEIKTVMNILKPFNFPKIDNGGGTGKIIEVNYSGIKDPQKVISGVVAVLRGFGLA